MAPRSVVVTGASRGLGAALALRFAEPGCHMLLLARSAEALAKVALDCEARGARVTTATLDVRDSAAVEQAVLAFDDAHPVDLAIANAGISRGRLPGGQWEGRDAVVDQIAVNLIGAMNLAEPLLPRMRARRAGHIALIASISAFRGMPDMRGYAASKAGLWSYGEGLRAALKRSGVALTIAAPGFFQSDMEARFQGSKPMAVTLDQAADRIARGLRRRAARVVFPLTLAFALRMLAILPAPLSDAGARLMRFRIAPED